MNPRHNIIATIALLFFFILPSPFLQAKRITPSQALIHAEKFLHQIDRNTLKKGKKTTFGQENTLQLTQETEQYYIFNQNNKNGYIILSADDQTIPVLGYSDENGFDPTNIPTALSQWLEIYQKEIQYISQQNGDPYPDTTPDLAPFFSTESIPPLIQAMWDQNLPYNKYCPIISDYNNTQTLAGCVATAMAMVMHYHQWPEVGVGSKEYITHTLAIHIPRIDFSSVVYDWGNMKNIYDGTTSTVEDNAVATLIYHCGVTVDMDYNISEEGGSGAYTRNIANALKQYFKYDNQTRSISRYNYTFEEWKNIIKTELKAGRPVIHSGNTGFGGHSFICDGFDEQDYFHFNWGWSGNANGYFVLSSLNPNFVGSGGSPGGYDQSQWLVIGIQKPNPNSAAVYEWYTSKDMTTSTPLLNRSGYISVNGGCYNSGAEFTGVVGIGLFKDGVFLQDLKTVFGKDIQTGVGFSNKDFSFQIPSSYPEGEYQLRFVSKQENESSFQPVRIGSGINAMLKATLSTSTITITPIPNYVTLQTAGDLIIKNSPYTQSTLSLEIPLQNPTDTDFYSFVAVHLTKVDDNTIEQISPPAFITIPSQTTSQQKLSLFSRLPPGHYKVALAYDHTNRGSEIIQNFTYITPGKGEITLLGKPSGTPLLVADSIVFAPSVMQSDQLTFSAKISNQGVNSVYDNRVFVNIFQPDGKFVTQFNGPMLQLTYPQEQVISFSGIVNLAPGNYFGSILYRKADAWSSVTEKLHFSVTSPASIDQVSSAHPSFGLYYRDGSMMLLEHNCGITSYQIYSLDGKEITAQTTDGSNQQSLSTDHLPKGIYLIRITDKEKIRHSGKLIVQ